MKVYKLFVAVTFVGMTAAHGGETQGSTPKVSPPVTESKFTNASTDALMSRRIEGILQAYLATLLNDDVATIVNIEKITPDQIKDISELATTANEKQIFDTLAQKADAGTLARDIGDVVDKIIADLSNNPKFKDQIAGLTPEKKQYVIATVSSSIVTALRVRGLTRDSQKTQFVEWVELGRRMGQNIDTAVANKLSFLDQVRQFTKAQVVSADDIEVLVNGEASFAKRDELMKNKNTPIDVMSWAIYDDQTGHEAVDFLLAKHAAGTPVRVMIDGQVSRQAGYGNEVARLEAAGVPVIRWINPEHLEQGQHRKMIIVDNEHVIAGGLNFGDVYSHKNPKTPQWRDTDIYLRGKNVARQASNFFAALWNEQIRTRGLELMQAEVKPLAPATGREVYIINSDPSVNISGSTIMLTILAAIRSATSSIAIENAYVVTFPKLKDELAAAVKRGVQVRVLTNSSTSVDEPIVSLPILRTMKDLAGRGVEAYLKIGDTLHSKFLVIDEKFSMVMSYNLHPRSERIEGEMAIASFDKKLAQDLTATFADDISAAKATKVNNASEIVLPPAGSTMIVLRLFFDPL